MDKILAAVNQYDLVVYLIPGIVFCQLTDWFYGTAFIGESPITIMITSYIFGMLIGSIGSIVIEPICKCFKIINMVNYDRWSKALDQCERVETLTTKTTVYRSWIALIVVQIILSFILPMSALALSLGKFGFYLSMCVVFLLLVMAYRKQVNYVRRCVDSVLSDS